MQGVLTRNSPLWVTAVLIVVALVVGGVVGRITAPATSNQPHQISSHTTTGPRDGQDPTDYRYGTNAESLGQENHFDLTVTDSAGTEAIEGLMQLRANAEHGVVWAQVQIYNSLTPASGVPVSMTITRESDGRRQNIPVTYSYAKYGPVITTDVLVLGKGDRAQASFVIGDNGSQVTWSSGWHSLSG